jgi:hypothetical protein
MVGCRWLSRGLTENTVEKSWEKWEMFGKSDWDTLGISWNMG